MIFNQQIVRVRAGQRTTRGGDVVEDWSPDAVDRLPIEAVSVQPRSGGEEITGDGDQREIPLAVYTEPGTTPDVTDLDRIEYRGSTYAVDGPVRFWPSPFDDHHLEFTIRTFKG